MSQIRTIFQSRMLSIVASFLTIGGCATAAWGPFVEGQTAHQRGDYPTAVMKLEEALKAEPTSTIIQSSLNQAKNSWALELLKESDQIPSTDLDNRLQRIKKAAELSGANPDVIQKLKEAEGLANNLRAQATKVTALADEGNYPAAQSILDEIKKYNLAEIKSCAELLKNSMEAHTRVSQLESKRASVFSSYREFLLIQKTEPLGKAAKGLIAEKLGAARSKLSEQLSSRTESAGNLGPAKLSTRLSQFYKSALSEKSDEVPPIEVAVGRINVDPIKMGVYTGTPGTPIGRIRPALEKEFSKEVFNIAFLPPKPSKRSLEGLEIVVVLKDFKEEIVEKGRDNPRNNKSEYISSYRTVPNPEYPSAVAEYRSAQVEYNRLDRLTNTLGGIIVYGVAFSAAKERLSRAAKVVQSTPQTIQEPVKVPYQYQEYNIALEGRVRLSYQLIDVKRRIQRNSDKFESAVKEERWRELQNVDPRDAAGLQNSVRDREFRDQFTSNFRQEANDKLAQTLLEEVLSALRVRYADSIGSDDMEAALEEAIRYIYVLYSQKRPIDKEANEFVATNFLSTRLTSTASVKDRPPIPWQDILYPETDKRYSLKEVEDMLRGAMAPKRVAELAEEAGIKFEVTDEVKARLRKAGASGELIERLERL